MGLLDDAIREHLELKRRRGAEPEEIARQEREALGPLRRTPGAGPDAREPAPEVDDAAEAAAREGGRDVESAAGAARSEASPAAPEGAVRAGDDIALPPDAGREEPPAPEREPDVDRREPPDGVGEPGEPGDPGVDRREPPRGAGGPGEPADRGFETSSDDDVLEEIPDFLQETPEHDRLWFEQRPPRDFEF